LFANRYAAFVDACSLVGVLKRDLLLTLAEAEFFRVRWSRPVLDEAQRAIQDIMSKKGRPDCAGAAPQSRASMEKAFKDAMVEDFDDFLAICGGQPDPADAYVLAAALKSKADVIVSNNLKHFPIDRLKALGLDVCSADAFIADTITLDEYLAIAAIGQMRARSRRPALTADPGWDTAGPTELLNSSARSALSVGSSDWIRKSTSGSSNPSASKSKSRASSESSLS
jgi:predicted nucleic acid-binding protein